MEETQHLLGMPSEFWAALIGAVVGALVSGGISWFLQRQQFKYERDTHSKTELELKQMHCRTMLSKLGRLQSDFKKLDKQMKRGVEHFEKEGAPSDMLWAYIKPVPNLPREIRFSDNELEIAALIGDGRLSSKLISLESVHESNNNILKQYRNARIKLRDQMPVQAVDVQASTLELSVTDFARLNPLMTELNSLVEFLSEESGGYRKLAKEVDAELLPAVNKMYGLKLRRGVSTVHKPENK